MNICVYGASSNQLDPEYLKVGETLGEKMAERGHALIFGGGAQGMMGAVARGMDRGGGSILGIAPSFFNVDGILYTHCREFIYTETMRERKQLMEERADAFVMTVGGIGTFEEFFEILTLKQLGRHAKPIAVLNTKGYFDDLLRQLQRCVDEKFMTEGCLAIFRSFEDPEAMLQYLETADTKPEDVRHLKNI
jgi:hypothetical protein